MPDVTCQQCGTKFDTDRDSPEGDYADTSHCPYCGTQHGDEAEAADDGPDPAATDVVEYTCPVCKEAVPSRDHFVDHLSNHGVFTAVTKQAESGILPRVFTDGGQATAGGGGEAIDVNLNLNISIDDE